ncbi:MAG: anthranilate phosphoribosyltransferase [Gemmatimonadales bacterium]|nr:MAG: anthranilate phosphoribosyltransferase [Gemmatimonadales bacterium]
MLDRVVQRILNLRVLAVEDRPIARALRALAFGERLGEALAEEAFAELMGGEVSPAQAAALLMGLRVRGETADEIAGAARALRGAMLKVETPRRDRLIDTCGTGGGTVPTFNVSTAAAFVAVGAGARVAKHGNRSYTSKCGSADVLEALGIPITMGAEEAARLLDASGFAFLFAPLYHPAMKFVAPVRKELGVPTIMNVLGPLANPAGVRRQLVGVADRARAPAMAEALARLGAEHALVVHAKVGMDEIAPVGPTEVWEVMSGEVRHWTLDPEKLGAAGGELDSLAGVDPAGNARRIRRLFEKPKDDPVAWATVILNAAAALYVAGLVSRLSEGVELAAATLEEGKAAQALQKVTEQATALN